MSIDPELWHRARPILDQALALPPGDRPAFVAQETADAPDLHRALVRLLGAAEDDRPFLEALDEGSLDLLSGTGGDDPTGRLIGPYRLLRLLGSGGMGAVYLAERDDGEFDQRVAVKLIRWGPLAEDAVGRFRRERQILAWLNHPNIARLLDGGVTGTGPYLVMEYVEGEPIDQYCDQRGLGIADRIRVFLAVCEAVEYAHRNLVVHRDLKPGNILVTPTGEAKLLDFGIARLLDTDRWDGPVTDAGAPLLTREYASPEQIRGGPLTTGSDVYALGAVLYQLLTGRLPHQVHGMSPAALEHEVCEVVPARPSTLRPALRGDLDTILLHALQPDPARRYGSARALADDLRRHLDRRPVAARPDTVGYRASRFVRRHAVGVAALAVIAAVLVGGALTTAYQGALAQRRFQNVRTLANAMLSDLHDAVRALPGATVARELLVSHALQYLDQLRAEDPSDPELLLDLGAAYEQIGEIQGNPHRTNLGDLKGALASYGNARDLRETVWKRDSTNATVRHLLGTSYGQLAVVTSWSGRNDEAIVLSRRSIDLLLPLHRDGPAAPVVAADLGRVESELGWWLIWAGKIEEGLAHLSRGVELLEKVDRRGADADPGIDLWRAYSYQVDGLRFSSRQAEALELLESTALPHLRDLATRHAHNQAVQYELSVGLDFEGALYQVLGRLDESASAYRTSRQVAERLVRADSADQKASEGLARSHGSLGEVLVRSGRVDEAIASFEEGSRLYSAMLDRNPTNPEYANMLGNTRRRLCSVIDAAGRPDEALESCLAAERALERAIAAMEANAVARANLAATYVQTARVYRRLASRADLTAANRLRGYARSRYRDALRVFRELDQTDAVAELRADSVAAELATLPNGR